MLEVDVLPAVRDFAPVVRKFGRFPVRDRRDLKMSFSAEAAALPKPHGYRFWLAGPTLDQGTTSQCVAYSGKQYLAADPVRNKLFMTAAQLYKHVQRNGEWNGEDYDGTSVHALFKCFKDLGYVERYEWTSDNDVLTRFLER